LCSLFLLITGAGLLSLDSRMTRRDPRDAV
jgi:hypothetical protein